MKYEAMLAGKGNIIVEAPNATEAQKLASRIFRTKRTVYVHLVNEEKGNASGVQLACENKD